MLKKTNKRNTSGEGEKVRRKMSPLCTAVQPKQNTPILPPALQFTFNLCYVQQLKVFSLLDWTQGCARDSLLLPWVGCEEFLSS